MTLVYVRNTQDDRKNRILYGGDNNFLKIKASQYTMDRKNSRQI